MAGCFEDDTECGITRECIGNVEKKAADKELSGE